jgi:hypothetical protein
MLNNANLESIIKHIGSAEKCLFFLVGKYLAIIIFFTLSYANFFNQYINIFINARLKNISLLNNSKIT